MQPVRDLMLAAKTITAFALSDEKTVDTVTIKDLYELFKGQVTRLPILSADKAVSYIIHQSLLFKFISRKSMEVSAEADEVSKLSFQTFLEFEDMREMVEGSRAFVPIDATVGDAKKKMDETTNCQDVFVTENGKPDEVMMGWLTNTDIAKHLKA
jgi:hypothetical protein